ncbi:hypothetical protein GCM10012285_33040 [Streptomyces kronopolitis]|uniref:IPT/TIG domain-containing protein n=1 Tax=Streptomyces kronopolitis TaxID=1612435 RepID=A0ABQ2JH19_9ACTN|nr:IPT/TIG domain-containing protein [Streptomyces kronopolitis]GGN47388.1 hypothetical protein GCM10012285_33040 [Streptomyces kronopolitis]
MTVIDSVTNTVVATLPAGTNPQYAAVAPNGNIYVTNSNSGNVSVFPPFPTLTGITPACGPTAGGTVVTISGTSLAGADVTIGGVPATGVSVNPGGTQITATTPAGVAGAATVAVATCGGTVSLPAAFTYTAVPTLTGISPACGPLAGGTMVTITGTNLTGAIVTIGGNPATGVSVNPGGTQITATTPAGVAGAATVTVTACGGTVSLPAAFTYTAVPTLTGISPACGPTAGGTMVTISGTNLTGATVTIGGVPATNVFYNLAGTQITATTPAGVAGAATVAVTPVVAPRVCRPRSPTPPSPRSAGSARRAGRPRAARW